MLLQAPLYLRTSRRYRNVLLLLLLLLYDTVNRHNPQSSLVHILLELTVRLSLKRVAMQKYAVNSWK